MTPLRKQVAVPVPQSAVWRQTIEGSDLAVRDRLIKLQASGELVAQGPARQISRRTVAVEVAVRPLPPTPGVRTRRAGIVLAVAVGTVAVAVAVSAVWWLVAHSAQVGGAMLAVLLVWFAVTRLNHSGACPGVHCSGCRGGHR